MRNQKLSEPIRCYDNGGKTIDRYTVVYMARREPGRLTYECLGMSAMPFHPCGFGQHSSAMPGRHLGKRIAFDDLLDDCKKLVMSDLSPEVCHDN